MSQPDKRYCEEICVVASDGGNECMRGEAEAGGPLTLHGGTILISVGARQFAQKLLGVAT
jgi:hypothetical protein